MMSTPQPDPSVIGGVAKAPFVRLPDPAALFDRRAGRFEFLAQGSNLAPYLEFLAAISRAQARLVAGSPPPALVPPERLEVARAAHMPPLDRRAMAQDPALVAALEALLTEAAGIAMPEPAARAREAVAEADAGTKAWLLDNVLSDAIPADSPAPHLFAAAAAQVVMARAAAGLAADRLVPIATGICPACGGRPVSSRVVEVQGVEGARYACCATCATEWNEVRVKCLCCGSTKGIGYRGLDTGEGPPPEEPAVPRLGAGSKALEAEATVKAEVCDECKSWVKILYANRNPSLDPVADDVASLGLDMRMRETEWRRAGVNPWLVGY